MSTTEIPSGIDPQILADHDAVMMAIVLPDARELSDEVLEALRLRAVRAGELGLTESQVAQILGVARETVCRGWSA
jgi:hypothetical protein